MKKKSGELFESIQVDPITGNYYVIIPEIAMNELSWYEDSQIQFTIEGDELILSEKINE
jgi:antitoxin component of MazEF toxin-antitoxin module